MHPSTTPPELRTSAASSSTPRHLATRAGVLAILSLLLVSTLVSPADAAKKSEPASTGVVERMDTIGGHVIEPTPIDIDGDGEPNLILTVVGWDTALPAEVEEEDDELGAFCGGQPPVFNGVEQFVGTPAGNATLVVHNADIPVILFDVTEVVDEDDFNEKCAAGDLEPFAAGTVKQRPILHFDEDGLTVKVKSRGVVTEHSGQQEWQLQAFLREFIPPPPSGTSVVLNSWVSLRQL